MKLNEWMVTDNENKLEGYTQYVKRISETEFKVIEHDNEYGFDADKFVVRECYIDLTDYTDEEILKYLKSYGYTERQIPQIEAECIAEQSMETVIVTDDFTDIVNWEERQGIDCYKLFRK